MERAQLLQTTAQLREAMEQAKALYERAKAVLKLAAEVENDVGAQHPDSALLYPTRLQTHALEEYRRALFRYNRFVLDGRLPEENSAQI
jgi:hypothetical protein